MKSILNPKFEYTPSIETDIRKTFEKARERIAREKAREVENKPLNLKEAREKNRAKPATR